jgi:hypothetical protein
MGLCTLEPTGAFGVGLWKNVRKSRGLSQPVPDSKWEMGPGLAFDMICGVRI